MVCHILREFDAFSLRLLLHTSDVHAMVNGTTEFIFSKRGKMIKIDVSTSGFTL